MDNTPLAFGAAICAIVFVLFVVFVMKKAALAEYNAERKRAKEDAARGYLHGERIARAYRARTLTRKGMNRVRMNVVQGDYSPEYVEGFCHALESRLC